MNRFLRPLALLLLAGILVIATGCTRSSETETTPLVYRLKWLFNASVAGELWAMAHDRFTEAGLHVTVKEGGPERDAIKELELGHARFGVATADMVIRALSQGSPVVVVAQRFQKNPLQWIYRPDRVAVESPADLRGKVLGITFGGNDETIMRALLAKYAIPEGTVELFSVRYDYTPFYTGRVDLWPVYRNAQGIIIGEKLAGEGEPFAFFDPDAAGIRFVANSVVTTQKMVAEHTDQVRTFVTALLDAWETALAPENAEEAVETIRRFDKDTPAAQIQKQLAVTRSLVKPAPDFKVGTIDTEAWRATERIMLDQGLIPEPVGVERALRFMGEDG